MGTRLQEVAVQAGPVNEHEAVLTAADMPVQEKAELLRRAKANDNEAAKQRRAEATDNEAAKQLRTEAITARGTARGADHRLSGLQKEMSLRTRRGRRPTDVDEPLAPASSRSESSYANRATTDHTPTGLPPEGVQDAPPV